MRWRKLIHHTHFISGNESQPDNVSSTGTGLIKDAMPSGRSIFAYSGSESRTQEASEKWWPRTTRLLGSQANQVARTRIVFSDADHSRQHVFELLSVNVQKLRKSVEADAGVPICDDPNVLCYASQQMDSAGMSHRDMSHHAAGWIIFATAERYSRGCCAYMFVDATFQAIPPLGLSFEH